jgi:hypothetical protein
MPHPISLEEWTKTWLPGLEKDGRAVAAFPTPDGKMIVVEPARMSADIEGLID